MSLLNKLIESRKERISQLRGKYEDIIESSDMKSVEEAPELGHLQTVQSIGKLNNEHSENDNNDDDDADDDDESQSDSDISISSDDQEDQIISVTKDLEIKLKPQLNELEKRTNMALKRILRRSIIQNDIEESE